MGDLRSRAKAHLSGPRPLYRLSPGRKTPDSLVQHYVDGGPWTDPELQRQLALCIEEEQASADARVGATGLGRDAHFFHQGAAALLREIQAEVVGPPG